MNALPSAPRLTSDDQRDVVREGEGRAQASEDVPHDVGEEAEAGQGIVTRSISQCPGDARTAHLAECAVDGEEDAELDGVEAEGGVEEVERVNVHAADVAEHLQEEGGNEASRNGAARHVRRHRVAQVRQEESDARGSGRTGGNPRRLLEERGVLLGAARGGRGLVGLLLARLAVVVDEQRREDDADGEDRDGADLSLV